MMRSLAEFVMKGRGQAILVVVLTGAIPWIYFINPIVVGLVILRRGLKEATPVIFFAALAIGIWAMNPSLAVGTQANLMPLLLLFGVSGLAVVLRATSSWQITVLAGVAVNLGIYLYLRLQPALADALFAIYEEYTQSSGLWGQFELPLQWTREQVLALNAWVYGFVAVLLLMVARWLQAMLYNPGGFRAEFHELRIEKRIALLLIGVLLLSAFGVLIPPSWFRFFTTPLLFAGIALVHATVALKQLSSLWLFAFYAVSPAILQFMVIFALIDSWQDFRKYMRKPA